MIGFHHTDLFRIAESDLRVMWIPKPMGKASSGGL